MNGMLTVCGLLVSTLCTLTVSDPAPQFLPPGTRRDPHHSSRHWTHPLRNLSIPAPNYDFLDPATSPGVDSAPKAHVPRQSGLYGAPNALPFGYPGRNENPYPLPPPQAQPSGYPQGFAQGFPQGSSQGFSQGYPQIYKVDNLVIIANPPLQQACPSQPNLKPLDPNTFPGSENDPDNRIGDSSEPTKCTWAIVACCAPNNPTVRYNCFELMGCPGLFLDQNPCSPRIVDAATRAALAFYSSSGSNNTSTDNNL